METTGITPAVSVYISCGSLFVAACALALELRRWFDEGVKLRINVMAEAKIAGGLRPDDNSYVAAHVANRDDAATTITHMYLEFFPTKFARFVGRLPLTLRRWIKKLGSSRYQARSIFHRSCSCRRRGMVGYVLTFSFFQPAPRTHALRSAAGVAAVRTRYRKIDSRCTPQN